jgi:hypothetical protein
MNSNISIYPSIPLSSYFLECLWYFVPMSIFHLAVFLIGCLILWGVLQKKPDKLRKQVGRFGLFLVLFLVMGSLVHGLWSCLIWNRFYHSSDYVFDFIPFVPVTTTVEAMRVDGYGTSTIELNFIWFAFAAMTWIITVVLYRLITVRQKISS